MTPLESAKAYLTRGWKPIPVPYRSKNPGLRNWAQLRLTEDTLADHFKGEPQNIGVLTGEPSGGLIDVDLDHTRALELADAYLPATPSVFGRASKPRSHWLYRWTRPMATRKFRSKSAGMLVEVRSTGAQTVFPHSAHESGEDINWENESAAPAEVDPDVLLAACEKLADAVKLELGEKNAPRPKPIATPRQPEVADDNAPAPTTSPQVRCLNAMRRAHIVDKSDGSHRLFTMACRCIEHDLQDADAVACIREYAVERPFPREYSDAEIITRLRDAEKRCKRGLALETEDNGMVKLGSRDPGTGRLVLSPRRTLPTAEAYVREFHMHPDGLTLRNYAGMLLGWRDNHYAEVEDARMRNRLQPWLHDALRYVFDKRAGGFVLANFESNPSTVNAALETIRNYVHLPASTTPPAWLEGADGRPDPREILCCKTINLRIPTGEALPTTPALFTTNALDFDYDPQAPAPVLWLRFLNELWGDDIESIELLQEWCGYSLVADTSQQKMLLMVGPKRSGKGTVARVLTSLIGKANVVGPTMTSLGGAFGLQPLIGKSLAIVSDARFGGENIGAVIERLLCVSGEDTLTIDRKYLPSVTMRLPTRFMFLTNELPKLCDASGALAGRFLILRLTKSFYDCEDQGLTDKLLKELPAVLLWSLQGWLRLRQRGRFVQPKSVGEIIRDLEDLSSPVGAFVREQCVVGPGKSVAMNSLYQRWKLFCEEIGREHPGTTQSFGRDLHAVLPHLGTRNRRVGEGRDRYYEGIDLAD